MGMGGWLGLKIWSAGVDSGKKEKVGWADDLECRCRFWKQKEKVGWAEDLECRRRFRKKRTPKVGWAEGCKVSVWVCGYVRAEGGAEPVRSQSYLGALIHTPD